MHIRRLPSYCVFHLLRDLSCLLLERESDLELLLLDELELDDDELELELRLLLLLLGDPCFLRSTSLICAPFYFCSASFLCLYWTSLLIKVDIIRSAYSEFTAKTLNCWLKGFAWIVSRILLILDRSSKYTRTLPMNLPVFWSIFMRIFLTGPYSLKVFLISP